MRHSLAARADSGRPMKIAVFDVSHWHFPLYLSALRDPGVQVVGVSDTASFGGSKFADQLNCRLYESNEDLLNEDFDDASFQIGRNRTIEPFAQHPKQLFS